jgi:hypothetical protein
VSALAREKRLPKLQKLLVKYPRERAQTRDELRALVRQMVNTFKGP